ncbi:MAG: RluA family pseudouridine synthase [Rhabdochlamydiaceae bacterium]
MDIVFEDNHILLVNKIAGMPTQPNDTGVISLQDQAKSWIKLMKKKPGDVFVHPIHRLDKGVSGLVLFAKTSKALSRLNAQMREKTMRKIYYGIVEGEVTPKKGRLENFLKHGAYKALISSKEDREAKQAILDYEVIKVEKAKSFVEISLLTGRYHQIRAQFSFIGHPLWGDQKYGSSFHSEKICLHHGRFSFIHPVTKEFLTFEKAPSFF